MRVHRLNGTVKLVAARSTYVVGSMRSKGSAKIGLAIKLLDRAASRTRGKSVVVTGASFGTATSFLETLAEQARSYVVQIRPGTRLRIGRNKGFSEVTAAQLLSSGTWRRISVTTLDGARLECSAAKLASVALPTAKARLFAAQVGGIRGVHRGTIIGLSSFDAPIQELVQLATHSRSIRRASREEKKSRASRVSVQPKGAASSIKARANIASARRQDARAPDFETEADDSGARTLSKTAAVLNVVELFSGAGGMGLGFLLGQQKTTKYRIVYSGEANPIFAETLRSNHRAFVKATRSKVPFQTPDELLPTDLRQKRALEEAVFAAKSVGGAHVLIGGPPCQGFSMANRNSWSAHNPHNELVDVFIKYIRRLRPLAFLMENVQGMLWTPNAGGAMSVVDTIERRLQAAGYVLFPKLLDAVWYGVPLHRTRFFILGLNRELGYTRDSFGSWGPFPRPTHGKGLRPFVTVKQGISDLPRIGNGNLNDSTPYCEPPTRSLSENDFLRFARSGAETGIISDHVTSRHADYVIERYKRIPAGENWESIRDEMTNYANVARTHSNIYRRLRWSEPSITIGHYRKSMLVHPKQHRGLSLREASRLQSFPDWFRFAGRADGQPGGLVHKQQQLANAVCPLVTKAIAEYLLKL